MLKKNIPALAVAAAALLLMALAPAQADWDEVNKTTLSSSGQCLDVSKADKDTPATVAPCNSKNTQKFWIELVPGTVGGTGSAATKPVRFRLVNNTQPFLGTQCLGLKDPSGGVVVIVDCPVGSPFTDAESFDWVKPTAGLQGVNFVRGSNVLGLKGTDLSASPGAATGWDIKPYAVVCKIEEAGAAGGASAANAAGGAAASNAGASPAVNAAANATSNATGGAAGTGRVAARVGRRLAA